MAWEPVQTSDWEAALAWVTGMVPMLSVTEMAHSSENNCSHFRPVKITFVLASALVSRAQGFAPGKAQALMLASVLVLVFAL